MKFYNVLNKNLFFVGHDTKAMLNNSGPRYKRSKLERDINKDVLACVFILFILCIAGGVGMLCFCYLRVEAWLLLVIRIYVHASRTSRRTL